jgi:hypothetical protein
VDGVAGPDEARLEDAAEHAAAAAELLLEAGADVVHEFAGLAGERDFEDGVADAQALAARQRAKVEPLGGDVLFDDAGGKAEFCDGFDVHEQNLARAAGMPVGAAFEAAVGDGAGHVERPHREAMAKAAEQVQDVRHEEYETTDEH